MTHVYNRSGLASVDDLNTIESKLLFNELEEIQSLFSKDEDKFLGDSYKWPRRPLYWWSRCWEYPYVFYHIRKWKESIMDYQPKIVDLGCGVTFFPFSIAQQNCNVIGVDIDPITEKYLINAANMFPVSNGSVSFKLTNGESLPFKDNEIDAVYCVSVLEHIEDPTLTIKEVARVLKKNGLFVLTIDVDLKGNFDIGPDKFNTLINLLQEYFEWIEPERTVHPSRLLKSSNGPYPWNVEIGVKKYLRPLKEFIKLIIGRARLNKLELACYGVVVVRK